MSQLAPAAFGGLRPIATDDYLLAALATTSEPGVTATTLKKMLSPIFSHRCPNRALGALIDAGLARLAANGLADHSGKGRWRATPAAVSTACSWDPAASPPVWNRLRDLALIARAFNLDLATPDREALLRSADHLTALVLAHGYRLTLDRPLPSLAEVRTALVWSAFEQMRGKPVGPLRKRPLTGNTVTLVILADLCDAAPTGSPATLVKRLAARLVGAPRVGTQMLRIGILRTAWDRANAEAEVPCPPEPAAAPIATVPPPPDDLATFAATVDRIARASTTGRFGDDRVFISHIWRQFTSSQTDRSSSLDGFKRRLVEAHRAGLLTLSKADLPAVLDPKDVCDSLTLAQATDSDLHGWHFVRIRVMP